MQQTTELSVKSYQIMFLVFLHYFFYKNAISNWKFSKFSHKLFALWNELKFCLQHLLIMNINPDKQKFPSLKNKNLLSYLPYILWSKRWVLGPPEWPSWLKRDFRSAWSWVRIHSGTHTNALVLLPLAVIWGSRIVVHHNPWHCSACRKPSSGRGMWRSRPLAHLDCDRVLF